MNSVFDRSNSLTRVFMYTIQSHTYTQHTNTNTFETSLTVKTITGTCSFESAKPMKLSKN